MDENIQKIVVKYSSICAILAVQPIPFADILILTPVQALMGSEIAKFYNLDISQQKGTEIIKQLMGVIGMGIFSQQLAIGLYKLIPYFGIVSTIPTVFALTFAMGKLMDKYFQGMSNGVFIDDQALRAIWEPSLDEGKDLAKERDQESMNKEYEEFKEEKAVFFNEFYGEKVVKWDKSRSKSEQIARGKADNLLLNDRLESEFFVPQTIEIKTTDKDKLNGLKAESLALHAIYEELIKNNNNYRLIYSKCFDFKIAGKIFLGEIDFILFDLNEGFIVIEVKNSLKKDSDGNVTYHSGNLNKAVFQVETNKHALVEYVESKYPGIKKTFKWEKAILVPKSENVSGDFEMQDNIISVGELSSRIPEIFKRRDRQIVDKQNVLKVFELFKKIDEEQSPIEKISIHKEFLQEKINKKLEEDYFNISLNTLVMGGPGTGKTFHAVKMVEDLLEKDSNILFTCYNKSLATEVASQFSTNRNVTVKNIHKLINDIYPGAYRTNDWNLTFIKDIDESMIVKKYDYIIIDEGQDFKFDWIDFIVSKLLNPRGKILICADETQNIFDGTFMKEYYRRMAMQIEMPEILANLNVYFLYTNYRNCIEVHRYIEKTMDQMKKVQYSTVLFDAICDDTDWGNNADVKKSLENILKICGLPLLENNVDTIILFNRKIENLLPAADVVELTNKYGVQFSTVQAFKGLEADFVIYLCLDGTNSKYDKDIDYEAMTRARFGLFVIRLSSKPLNPDDINPDDLPF